MNCKVLLALKKSPDLLPQLVSMYPCFYVLFSIMISSSHMISIIVYVFQIILKYVTLALKYLYNSSTYISKCPINIFLHKYPKDFKHNLSNPNKLPLPCPFQRNKLNNTKFFLKVSVTVKGATTLQSIQIDSSLIIKDNTQITI